MKNAIEIEGVICMRTLQMKFLNRSTPMFPTDDTVVKPGEIHTIKLDIAFPCELSGKALVKLFTHLDYPCTMKLNVIRNTSAIEFENCRNVNLVFNRRDPMGIIDARSLGYYHVPHEAISTALTPKYKLVTANHMQLAMNKLASEVRQRYHPKCPNDPLQKETLAQKDEFPWLEPDDPRRNMSDEEILHTTIDLSKSALDDSGKSKLMDLLCQYKGAFSLHDEIAECPNLEINIDVIDDSPFFV